LASRSNSGIAVFLAGIGLGAFGAIFVTNMLSDDASVSQADLTTAYPQNSELPSKARTAPRAVREEARDSPADVDGDMHEASSLRPENQSGEISQAADNLRSDPQGARSLELVERTAVRVSEAHKDLLARQDGAGRSDVHAELEAEPEDDSWSYFMEQALNQFISRHPNTSKFAIFNIECRTTLCEIQAVGYDDSTSPDWSRILYDLQQEPWYEFGQVGTSSTDYQGQLAVVTHLRRRNIEAAP